MDTSCCVCVYVCVFVHVHLHGLCFHVHWFTVNPQKEGAVCVFVSRKKEGSVLSFKSSRHIPRMKYLGSRSLDLPVLAETPGTHWFLTRQLGRHYNKMHYSQPHISSDTHTRLTPSPPTQPSLATVHVRMCVCLFVYSPRWTQPKTLHFFPGSILRLHRCGPVKLMLIKCWQDIILLAFSQTHTQTHTHFLCQGYFRSYVFPLALSCYVLSPLHYIMSQCVL